MKRMQQLLLKASYFVSLITVRGCTHLRSTCFHHLPFICPNNSSLFGVIFAWAKLHTSSIWMFFATMPTLYIIITIARPNDFTAARQEFVSIWRAPHVLSFEQLTAKSWWHHCQPVMFYIDGDVVVYRRHTNSSDMSCQMKLAMPVRDARWNVASIEQPATTTTDVVETASDVAVNDGASVWMHHHQSRITTPLLLAWRDDVRLFLSAARLEETHYILCNCA